MRSLTALLYLNSRKGSYCSPGLRPFNEFLSLRVNWSRREKTCLPGFRQREFQTSLLSYRDKLENRNFNCSKFTYNTTKNGITKALIRLGGTAGWSAPVLFANPRRQVFSHRGPNVKLEFETTKFYCQTK